MCHVGHPQCVPCEAGRQFLNKHLSGKQNTSLGTHGCWAHTYLLFTHFSWAPHTPPLSLRAARAELGPGTQHSHDVIPKPPTGPPRASRGSPSPSTPARSLFLGSLSSVSPPPVLPQQPAAPQPTGMPSSSPAAEPCGVPLLSPSISHSFPSPSSCCFFPWSSQAPKEKGKRSTSAGM